MAFRNELEAAQARADALQREVVRLEADNARLRGDGDVAGAPVEDGGRERRALIGAGVAAFAVFGAISVGFAFAGLVPFAVMTGAMGGAVGITLIVVSNLVHVVPPGFALVLSGQERTLHDGRKVGYRVVLGGRTLRIPMIEAAELIDCRPRAVNVRVNSAYSKGAVPLTVAARATIKVASTPPAIDNAIERFLGRDPAEIDRVAVETLEGNVRGVVATLTPDELRTDQVAVAQALIEEAEDDLRRLGIELDDFVITAVTDAGNS